MAPKCTRRAPDSSGNAPHIEHLGGPLDRRDSEPRWRTQALDWAERVTIRDLRAMAVAALMREGAR